MTERSVRQMPAAFIWTRTPSRLRGSGSTSSRTAYLPSASTTKALIGYAWTARDSKAVYEGSSGVRVALSPMEIPSTRSSQKKSRR